jgi:hypothetical protein
MLKLPKEHLSVSQINLWESDPIAYQKKYFIGIPDPPSPFLNLENSSQKTSKIMRQVCKETLTFQKDS